MSNGLAIAAITAVLKNLLEDGLVQHSALSSMGNVLLTTLSPDKISKGVEWKLCYSQVSDYDNGSFTPYQ